MSAMSAVFDNGLRVRNARCPISAAKKATNCTAAGRVEISLKSRVAADDKFQLGSCLAATVTSPDPIAVANTELAKRCYRNPLAKFRS
jgi:hypothetical protein